MDHVHEAVREQQREDIERHKQHISKSFERSIRDNFLYHQRPVVLRLRILHNRRELISSHTMSPEQHKRQPLLLQQLTEILDSYPTQIHKRELQQVPGIVHCRNKNHVDEIFPFLPEQPLKRDLAPWYLVFVGKC